MRKSAVDAARLLEVGSDLGDAAIDPAIWPEIMEQISGAVGATGATLLQSDVRTLDVPRTAGIDDLFRRYFTEGWHTRDIRADRGVPLQLRGVKVVLDQDIVTPQEMQRLGFYADNLAPLGFQWFAAVGFWAGSALWSLSIQRTCREGPFDLDDKLALAQLSDRLTEIATLSKAVGKAALSGITNALHLVSQPAIALDRSGCVLDMNAAAEQVFDDEFRVRNRRLCVRDQTAKAALDALVDQLRTTPDSATLPVAPIPVRRRAKRPLIIRTLPVPGAARSPFLGARALLVISDLSGKSMPQAEALAQAFGLSPAEAKLAAIIATGSSPERAAQQLGIARETARNQLKAVFAKTDTHRQSELVAVLSRI